MKMKILVIDDFAGNVASAKQYMPGHEVVVAESVRVAYRILKNGELFDAVLTDLFLPIGDFIGQMNSGYIKPGDRAKEIPAGLIFAIKAASKGIRAVICSDSDHHRDWICTLLDLVSANEQINPVFFEEEGISRKIVFVEARFACLRAYWDEAQEVLVPCNDFLKDGRWIKDWLKVMEQSTLFYKEGFC